MSENEKSCFECKLHPMCRIFHFISKNFAFDTMSVEYPEQHKRLYTTIGETCSEYKEDKK